MKLNDPGKFALLALAIIGAVVLLLTQSVTETAGVGIITYALGYVTGNGRLAARGERPEPTFGPRDGEG